MLLSARASICSTAWTSSTKAHPIGATRRRGGGAIPAPRWCGSITSIALGLHQSTLGRLDTSGIGGSEALCRREESFMFQRIVKMASALAVALATMLAAVLATA